MTLFIQHSLIYDGLYTMNVYTVHMSKVCFFSSPSLLVFCLALCGVFQEDGKHLSTQMTTLKFRKNRKALVLKQMSSPKPEGRSEETL